MSCSHTCIVSLDWYYTLGILKHRFTYVSKFRLFICDFGQRRIQAYKKEAYELGEDTRSRRR